MIPDVCLPPSLPKTKIKKKFLKKKTEKRERAKKNDTKMKHPQIITYKKIGEELF